MNQAISKPISPQHPPEAARQQPTSTVRLLIVDDDAADRALVRSFLDSEVYVIIEAGSAQQGLELAKGTSIDCALVDYNLPDMIGTQMLPLLRDATNDPHLPIILFTGQGDETLAVSAMRDGASDYLPKNRINPSSLTRVLVNGVRQASLSRALSQERLRILDMNQELIRANHEIGSFYQTVSHELKTPLMAIREFTSITLDEIGGPVSEKQREYLTASLGCCDRLKKMIDDLLDTARIETGKLSMDIQRCCLNSIIQDSVALVAGSARDNRITVKCELASDLPQVDADELRLQQVLNNLMTNAIKFTEADGTIIVTSARHSDSEIAFSVKDSGRGIDKKFHSTIFDRFEQTRGEDSEFHKGMGIGLYLCANIMENHKGSITVTSEPGVGSKFTATLPINQ